MGIRLLLPGGGDCLHCSVDGIGVGVGVGVDGLY